MQGDIIPPDEFKGLVIECKNYQQFPFHQLFDGKVKQLDKWLDQLYSTPNQKMYWLCLKVTHKGLYLIRNNSLDFKTNNPTVMYHYNNHNLIIEKLSTELIKDNIEIILNALSRENMN